MPITISSVSKEQRPIALRVLFARFPVEEQETRLKDVLQSVDRGSLKLDGLLLAEEDGQPVGAALTMQQRDGVTLVWPPVVTCGSSNEQDVENALMNRVCEEIEQCGSKLAQALLSPDDSLEIELLERFEFQHLADMFFLARTLSEEDATNSPPIGECDHDLFDETQAERFASVIERTYHESLDCPFLDGFRNGKDALFSHRLSGSFDPAGWRVYRSGDEDVGVMMMNEHPDQDAIELVYFGIVPEFRGKGIGRQMLAEGIQAAALTGRAALFLAVDCENVYANNLYGELGFAELARRRIMVRRFPRVARE